MIKVDKHVSSKLTTQDDHSIDPIKVDLFIFSAQPYQKQYLNSHQFVHQSSSEINANSFNFSSPLLLLLSLSSSKISEKAFNN